MTATLVPKTDRVIYRAVDPRKRVRRRFTFLRLLRQRYGDRPLYLLLDKAPCHDTKGSRALAASLRIELVWLPKQCSELNAMDHLWRHVKGEVSANWQWATVNEHADRAEQWVFGLSDREALRKAGILSEDFWLKHL